VSTGWAHTHRMSIYSRWWTQSVPYWNISPNSFGIDGYRGPRTYKVLLAVCYTIDDSTIYIY